MTNLELIRELRKPGKIYMPVIATNDVVHVAIEKSDLIAMLLLAPAYNAAPWDFYGDFKEGRLLDVA